MKIVKCYRIIFHLIKKKKDNNPTEVYNGSIKANIYCIPDTVLGALYIQIHLDFKIAH